MSKVIVSEEWIEIATSVDYEAVESVVELFSRYGYKGGVAIEEPFTQDQDGDNLAVDITRPFAISTFMSAGLFTPALREEIEQALWFLGSMRPVGALEVRSHHEQDWENAWKQHFMPVRASSRVIIRPPWHEIEQSSNEIVVTLDPGMAFGTGTHPTTRLCLELLEGLDLHDSCVLDAGTGTGVLAIAANMMGAGHVDAVDIDPVAVRQAGGNVQLNGLNPVISVWEDALTESPGAGKYDLVIANIISRILVEIHSALLDSMKPAGMLLLSGIIEDKEVLVTDCYQEAGMRLIERKQMGDWIAHIWKHQPQST